MKFRALWLCLILVVLTLGIIFLARRNTDRAVPSMDTKIAQPLSTKSKAEVAIEDGKTIDFSTGVPVVKDTAKDKAVLEKSVKEIEDAARDVSFGPPPAPSAETKKAEPEKAPPKE